jgi:hypothetical protein
MTKLLSRLAHRGKREILLVSSEDYRHIIDEHRSLKLNAYQQTSHRGMDLFNLHLHEIMLRE